MVYQRTTEHRPLRVYREGYCMDCDQLIEADDVTERGPLISASTSVGWCPACQKQVLLCWQTRLAQGDKA